MPAQGHSWRNRDSACATRTNAANDSDSGVPNRSAAASASARIFCQAASAVLVMLASMPTSRLAGATPRCELAAAVGQIRTFRSKLGRAESSTALIVAGVAVLRCCTNGSCDAGSQALSAHRGGRSRVPVAAALAAYLCAGPVLDAVCVRGGGLRRPRPNADRHDQSVTPEQLAEQAGRTRASWAGRSRGPARCAGWLGSGQYRRAVPPRSVGRLRSVGLAHARRGERFCVRAVPWPRLLSASGVCRRPLLAACRLLSGVSLTSR